MTTRLPDRLRLHRTANERGVVLELAGEVDLETAPAFEQAVAEFAQSPPQHLTIDLSAVEFMDSTGLKAIIKAQRAADSNGHQLSVRRGPAQVQHLFQLTGLGDRLTFDD